MFFEKYLLEIAAITVFLLVYWCKYKRRRQFAAIHSRSPAVQESGTGEPAALVTGTLQSLQAAAPETVDRGRMQVPVPEIDHGAASVLIFAL
jgi:hypothetical protein